MMMLCPTVELAQGRLKVGPVHCHCPMSIIAFSNRTNRKDQGSQDDIIADTTDNTVCFLRKAETTLFACQVSFRHSVDFLLPHRRDYINEVRV